MKKKTSKLLCMLLSLSMSAMLIPTGSVAAESNLTKQNGQVVTMGIGSEQIKGTEDGYSYELWNQYDQGKTTMVLGSGGAYQCSWDGIENVLFRRGVDFDCTKTYKELGNISVEYTAEYDNPTQNTYLCVYGWTKNPLIEYYIVDSWGSWRPPGGSSIGQINVDGGTYDVYVTDRINQPSIEGNTTFKQFWSVRTSKRTSGTISVSTHFAEWEKLGLETGKLYEAALNVEGYQSSGTANITKNVVTVGGEIKEPDPIITIEPGEDGYYYHCDFEDGTQDWDNRGDASVKTTAQVAYAGQQSISVTGRTDSWNGTARILSTNTFQPGQSYSFSNMVMQDATASEDFRLTLQYDAGGKTNYAMVASGTAAKGEWVQLANTSYTIPDGASNMLLYVETADSTTSFYVDEAAAAKGGTTIKPEANPPIDQPSIEEPPIDEPTVDKIGDVNADNKVDVEDAKILADYLVGKSDSITISNADVTKDGVVNVFDLAALKHMIHNGDNMFTPPSSDNSGSNQIDPSKPMVAISFDDGAVGTAADASSMRILNALEQSGFRATFFYVGNWTKGSDKEAEVKKAYDMGMEIANHTQSHPNLTEISADQIRNEYDSCANQLANILGAAPSKLMRLPYLAYDNTVTSTLYDVPMISCALDMGDWNHATKEDMVNKIKAAMADGSLNGEIILAHETYDTTAAAMEELCPYLKEQGWQVVTISEMFAAKGKTLTGGQVYTKAA